MTDTTLSGIRLQGTGLAVARTAWVIFTLSLGALFLASIPAHFRELQIVYDPAIHGSSPGLLQLTPFEVNRLADFGVSLELYAAYHVVVHVLFGLIFLAMSVMLFLQRSEEPVILFMTFVIQLFGFTFVPVIDSLALEVPLVVPIDHASGMLLAASAVLVFLIFPDGRFVPWWTVIIAIVWPGWMLLTLFFPQLDPFNYSLATGMLVTLVFVGMGLAGQWYRHRNVSTPEQRQQTKWVLFGLAVIVMLITAYVGLLLILPAVIGPEMVNLFLNMVWLPFMAVAIAVTFTFSVGFAVLRYRLWEIDYVLSRGLIYGMVTLLLGLTFLILFVILRLSLGSLLGDTQGVAAALIATATVFGLYSPTQRTLRRFVERNLYGIRINYTQDKVRPEPMSPVPDAERIGPYVLGERIGRGGMAEVYRGRHPTLNREVAIKVLHHNSPEVRARFEREARTVAMLTHPHIVQVFDFGEEEGAPFMVMAYINGPTLDAVIQERGALPKKEALTILQALGSALDYAHENGIVHRDMKAANVLMSDEGPVLTDFGVAKIMGGSTLQTGSAMIGTLAYMSRADPRRGVGSPAGCVCARHRGLSAVHRGTALQVGERRRFGVGPSPAAHPRSAPYPFGAHTADFGSHPARNSQKAR
ncbi:MAG: serine/threonine-protein kinase [Anaerolineae bacterium]